MNAAPTRLRASVIQAAPVVFNPTATIDKVDSLTARAKHDEGADLVLFPEAFVSAYPKGLDFGARVGMRTAAGRNDFARYHASSIAVPGPDTERLGSIAQKYGVWMTIGVIERDGGTLYCTALTFAASGALVAKRRKLMPTAMERLVWGYGDGSTLAAAASPWGAIGSVICWENYMPALRMTMYSQNVAIWCAPTADSRETWIPTMRHIAIEGRCFVLSSCQYLTRADCPKDYAAIQGDDPQSVIMEGGSCIVSPMGEILAGPARDGETILTAELDLTLIAKGKYDFDAVGHYARPDVFSLQVNTQANHPVRNAPSPLAVDADIPHTDATD